MSKKLLLVDDDPVFVQVLSHAMTRRGLIIITASSAEQALMLLQNTVPDLAIVDLKMQGASGMSLIAPLRELNPEIRILMLTGYASIATAVEAIKQGADQYLPKPAGTQEILQALLGATASTDSKDSSSKPDITDRPLSVARLEWEHIQQVLQVNDGNISATARALNMHRRTLQRKLAKYPVKQ